jgi:hypothetical protein
MTDDVMRPEPLTCTPKEAAQTLFHYGRSGGYPPGSFVASLLSAICGADPRNRALLALGFPGYVAAAELAEREGGVERLREIAGSES